VVKRTGASLPDINIFKRSEGAPVDRFPPGLDPDDPKLHAAYEKV
jgi:hypothetical protein